VEPRATDGQARAVSAEGGRRKSPKRKRERIRAGAVQSKERGDEGEISKRELNRGEKRKIKEEKKKGR